ncbi:YchJ family protein [Novispirillum itersonii]|uniref:YchJ family protein n=1 Tax=Novispirillum itersonii TaxID=189 RepID=UPI00037F51D4|nr:YchJ family protein [Novispirillum itersonii]
MSDSPLPCPCGSGLPGDACCGPLLAGQPAATAEALMRSRYTAFTHGDIAYLQRTMAPDIQMDFDPVETARIAGEADWLGLEVRAVSAADADTATVEYIASFRLNGQKRIHHERAEFRRDSGAGWLVCGGEVNPKGETVRNTAPGRNDPCSCGSGKKYKKCCGG